MALSPRFKEILDAVQAHMFQPGRGGRATLLDWPDELGEVQPDNQYVVTLRDELDKVRNVNTSIGRLDPQFWFFEAAVRFHRAWDQANSNEQDQPEAPWQLPYLAAIVGAWRDNAGFGNANAVWPRVGAGLLRVVPDPYGLYQVDALWRPQHRWSGLFESLAAWSERRTQGHFLALEAGDQPYVKFIRAQKVVARSDVEKIAKWLLDEVTVPTKGDLRRAIMNVPVSDDLKRLDLGRAQLDEELMEYVRLLVQREVQELRIELLNPKEDDIGGQIGPRRIYLQCYAWEDQREGGFKYEYRPTEVGPRTLATDWGQISVRDAEVVLEMRGRPPCSLTNDLLSSRRDWLSPHVYWTRPSERNPIVMQRQGSEWCEIPRYSEIDESREDYLVIDGPGAIHVLAGSVLVKKGLARERSEPLLESGSGVALGHDLYHSLALPRVRVRLDEAIGAVRDLSDSVCVEKDGRLRAVEVHRDSKQAVHLSAETGQSQRFAIRHPRVRRGDFGTGRRAALPRPGNKLLGASGDWSPTLEFKPDDRCFGLLQVFASVGPRSWAWARDTQENHFGCEGETARNQLYALLRRGHLCGHSSAADTPCQLLSVRAPNLVHLPSFRDPQGRSVYWLRGGFDWWRIESDVRGIEGLQWCCERSNRDNMLAVFLSGSEAGIYSASAALGAQVVDPIDAIRLLPKYHEQDQSVLKQLRIKPPFGIPDGEWSVSKPWSPTDVFRADQGLSNWGLPDLFGGLPMLAWHRQGPLGSGEVAYLLNMVEGCVRGVGQCHGATIAAVRRALMLEWWSELLAAHTKCDPLPALPFLANGSLLEPHGCDWPIELCAALCALRGQLPERKRLKALPSQVQEFSQALEVDEAPAWRGKSIAPPAGSYWCYEGCTQPIADLIANKLNWKLRTVP
jgi:hypothetical protein